MIAAPLRSVYALPTRTTIAQPAPKTSGGAPAEQPSPLGRRVIPAGIKLLEGSIDEKELWRLFDGQAQSAVDTGGQKIRFQLTFDSPTFVDAIGVFGGAKGRISVATTDGHQTTEVIHESDLSKGAWRWNRHDLPDNGRSAAVEITWQPKGSGEALRELEIWGRATVSQSDDSVRYPDALYAGLPAGARESRATESEQTVSLATRGTATGGQFSVPVELDPHAVGRAFLLYELAGLPHFTAVERSINGQRTLGGFGVSFGAAGGLQVEEIAPRWLRRGANTIQLLPADDHNPASYRVSHVRVVTVGAGESNTSAGTEWTSLSDGREDTGWRAKAGGSGSRAWTFASMTEPRLMELRLPSRGSGTLTIAAADDPRAGKVRVRLDEYGPGWHHVPLDKLPAASRLSLTLSGGREQGVDITELEISGSPVPSDEAPRIAITYPLSGECVNHKVHVRGFVDPPAATALTANGARLDGALSTDGAFAFELPEKAAGGGTGHGFDVALEATYPNGSSARRTVAIGACVDRPPVVTTDDGKKQQPAEDLGAPYGVTVKAGEAATLAFGGATLEIPAGATEKDVRVTIRPLDNGQTAAMDSGMTNVSPKAQAFRFGPHGMIFKKPVRISLPYDHQLLPRGYSPSDIRTFYYDESLRRWEQVGLLGQNGEEMIAASEHFTDFVNATIAMPDHPGTQSFNPTSLKDIKLADPAAGITQIEPPTGTSTGAADLRLPIEVPPGRRGLQPDIAITYDSEHKNGWLGVGWDLDVSHIEIDTRFGVPRYDGSETYMLDGAELIPISPPQGAPTDDGDYYARRVEGKFDWILRQGNDPTNYGWVVVDKNGTRYFYGETPTGRLTDPAQADGTQQNRFRWSLERIRDTSNNEMKFIYQTDTGSNPNDDANEPYVQQYLSRIDYTSNGANAFPASYHVDFVRGGVNGTSCDRLDRITTGRPGFRVVTACLLKQIVVRIGTDVVRQYNLNYQAPSSVTLDKTLLQNIQMFGLGAQTKLLEHDFQYFTTPTIKAPSVPDSLSIFSPPVAWAPVKTKTSAIRTADGLSHVTDATSSFGAQAGLTVFGESLDIGGGGTTSAETYHWQVSDFNGDGLPDGISDDGSLNVSALSGNAPNVYDPTTPGKLVGNFTPVVTSNFVSPFQGGILGALLASPLGSADRDVMTVSGGFHGLGTFAGSTDLVNNVRGTRTLIDMNGDGYLDQIFSTGSGVGVRLNDGHNNLQAAVNWSNFNVSQKTCNPLGKLANLLGTGLNAIGGLTRWISPFTGVLSLGGVLSKVTPGSGGKVLVSIIFNANTVWQHTIDKDDPPCDPGPANSCTGGLTASINAGDRVYLRTAPLEVAGEQIAWDPQLKFKTVGTTTIDSTLAALKEPTGASIYGFSQSADFRMVGRTIIPWTADSQGTVQVDGQIVKNPTSDDVTVKILRESADHTTSSVVFSQVLPGNSTMTVPTTIPGIAVLPGDQLEFQVLSDLAIDPNQLAWQPVVTYQNYCRLNPQTSAVVCGNVSCATDTTTGIVECVMAGDPVPTQPVPPVLLKQQATLFKPLFRLAPGTPTKTFVVPTAGTHTIAGTVTKASVTTAPVVVAIQGVNHLYAKHIFQPSDTGSIQLTASPSSLNAGDQLFFSVFSANDVSGNISWSPTVDGAAAPVNFKSTMAGAIADPSGVGAVDVMSGGYHGWSYGEWNEQSTFAESKIGFDPLAATHDFAPMIFIPPDISTTTGPGGNFQAFLGISVGGVIHTIDHGIGAAKGAITNAAGEITDIFGTAVGAGFQILGAVGNEVEGWFSSLFCTTEHPFRYTTSKNSGLDLGVVIAGAGFNTGSSQSSLDLIDMNGDRLPDLVEQSGIRYNTGTQFDSSTTPLTLPLGSIRDIQHKNVHADVSFLGSAPNQFENMTDDQGQPVGFYGAGAGLSYGISATDRDLIDVNGDGLPDHVSSDSSGAVHVRLNLGNRFSGELLWQGLSWNISNLTTQESIVKGFTPGDLSNDVLRLEDTATEQASGNVGVGNDTGGFGLGKGQSDTLIRQLVDMVDVTGDGLPDQVLRGPGMKCVGDPSTQCMKVKINLGDRFDGVMEIPLTPWSQAGASIGIPQSLSLVNIGGSDPDALGFTLGSGQSTQAQGSVLIPIVPPLFGQFGASETTTTGDTYLSMSFDDIDGDGTVDHVLKVNGNGEMYARLNTTGKANLLKHVSRPLGGGIDIDYARVGNHVDSTVGIDMPRNQWTLSTVTIDDGGGNAYTNFFDYSLQGPDVAPGQGTGSGHYARDEREDYGYGHVTMTRGVKQSNGTFAQGDGSRLERFFFNGDYYRKGLLRAEFEKTSGGGLVTGTLVTYADPTANLPPVRNGRFFPAETERVTGFYEGANISVGNALGDEFGLAPKYRLEKRTHYDGDGNLTNFEDWGDEQSTADDVAYTISYYNEPSNHITKAQQIDAIPRTAPSTLLRRRSATFDAGIGTIKTLTNVVSGGKVPSTGAVYNLTAATSSYTHDFYGNLQTYTDPNAYSVKYTYDNTTQTYVNGVDDQIFGYHSGQVTDLRFGAPLNITDMNGQFEAFTYDEFGRLSTVTGPTDQSSAPTIQMTYSQPAASSVPQAWASTKHRDVQAPTDPIETVTFVDGMGRMIQTKKDIAMDAVGNGSVVNQMTVSGQVTFDTRGRVKSQAKPMTDSLANAHTFTMPMGQNMDPKPTMFTYDILSRPTAVVAPDDTMTTTRYFVGPTGADLLGDGKTWLMTEVIDPVGNTTTSPPHNANVGRRLSYADSRGNRMAVREFNTVGTATTLSSLTTRYAYDPLNELTTVTDAKGNVTTAVYDTIGQMVSLTSPDAGRTEYRFDLAGNLGAKETPVLRAQGKTIQYTYDHDRLAKIDEPNITDVTYTYGTSAEKGNSFGNVAGRIKQVTSEGSTEQRTYDAFGNVTQTVTTLPNMASSNPATIAFTMKYTFDWLGRMQTMTFPNWIDQTYHILAGDGELVTYTYDRGGNLDKITGFDQTPNPQQTSAPRNFTYLSHMGYNELEQRTVLASGNGIANRYAYDPLMHRLTDISADSFGALEHQQNRAATPFHRMHYDYDVVGNVKHLQNRVSLQPWRNAGVFVGPLDVSYTYDNLYQLKTLTGKYRPNVAYGYQYSDSYVYDELGNMTKKSQSQDRLVWTNQNVTPTNDPTQAMAQLNGSTFDHNVTGLTYTLDYQYTTGRPHAAGPINETLPNQTASPRVIGYDADGNNVGNSFKGSTRTQVWDEEDRLKQVTVGGASAAKFKYNDVGERTKKQTAAGDSWYVNQYFVLLPNNLPTKHIFAGETRIASKTDAIYMQAPALNYYHPDNLGSTSYTSAANQDLVQHERYFAFGELWRPGAEQEETDLGRPDNLRREWTFLSKEWDVDTGLYYFGARYFDPHVDAWQSTDPELPKYMRGGGNSPGVFAPSNLGLYSYAWNNPVGLKDPNGRDVVIVAGPGRSDMKQSAAWYDAGARALGGQLVAGGLAKERVHIVASPAGAAAAARATEKAGRRVSGVVFIGHGAPGNLMTEANRGNFADTGIGELAHDAHVAKGGVAVSFACNTCMVEGQAQMDALQKQGIGVAGWEGLVHLDSEGGFDNGGVRVPIGAARPPAVTAPAEAGATAGEILLNAERRVNKSLGSSINTGPTPIPGRNK